MKPLLKSILMFICLIGYIPTTFAGSINYLNSNMYLLPEAVMNSGECLDFGGTQSLTPQETFSRSDRGYYIHLDMNISASVQDKVSLHLSEEVYRPDGVLYGKKDYSRVFSYNQPYVECDILTIKDDNPSIQLGDWKVKTLIKDENTGISRAFEYSFTINSDDINTQYRFPFILTTNNFTIDNDSKIIATPKNEFVYGKDENVYLLTYVNDKDTGYPIDKQSGYYKVPAKIVTLWWYFDEVTQQYEPIAQIVGGWSSSATKRVWLGSSTGIPIDDLAKYKLFGKWKVNVFVNTDTSTLNLKPLDTVEFTLLALRVDIQTPTTSTQYKTKDSNIVIGGITDTAPDTSITSITWENILTGETGSISGTQNWQTSNIPLQDKTKNGLGTENKILIKATNSLGIEAKDEISILYTNEAPSIKFSETYPSNDYSVLFEVADVNNNLEKIDIRWYNLATGESNQQTQTLSGGKTPQTLTYAKTGNLWTWEVSVTDKEGLVTTISKADNPLAKKTTQCDALAYDPIDLSSGAQTLDETLLVVKGIIPLTFSLKYYSLLRGESNTGIAWEDANYGAYLEKFPSGDVKIHWSANTYNLFPILPDGSYSPLEWKCRHDQLVKNTDGSFTLSTHKKQIYEFNAQGRLTAISNSQGQKVTLGYTNNQLTEVLEPVTGAYLRYQYNTQGLLISVNDSANRSVQLVYDSEKRLIELHNAAGEVKTFTYNTNNQIVSAFDNESRRLFYNEFDGKERVSAQIDALGQTASFAYQANAQTNRIEQVTVTSRLKDTKTYHFGSNFEVTKIVDELGNTKQYFYTATGKTSQITDEKGNSTFYKYDAKGDLSQVTDASGAVTLYQYDNQHNLLRVQDALEQTTTYIYDAQNRLTKVTNALNETVTYAYNANGQVTNIIKPSGGVLQYQYSNGVLTQITLPEGNVTQLTYDTLGRLISMTDAEQQTTSLSYDVVNRLVRLTNPLGHQWQYTYDSRNKITQYTDPNGNVYQRSYDENGHLSAITNPLNQVTSYAYDAEGRLISVTDALQRVTQLSRDAKGRLTTITLPSGATQQLSYDAVGQLQQQVDALGQTVAQFEYDARGLLLSQQDALGQSTEFEYDVLGRLTAEESASAQRTEFDYDALNRLVSSVDALQGESTQSFNADGQRVSLTDPNDNTTQFVFDQNGRLVSAATATGHTVQYQYNARNLLTQITNARGQAQQLSYDAVGRLVSLSDAVGQIQYAYDANGNVLTVTDSLGTITRTYDALNRVTAFTDTRGNSLAYQYDAVGNLTRLTYPDGKQVQYAYDVNDQLITVTDWAGRVTQYVYDANGRLSQTTRPNGTQQLRSYDAKGQLLTQTEQDAQGQVLFSYQFSYDAVGNIIAETVEPNLATLLPANTEMSYGLANRLATVDQHSITLDADGNMVEGLLQGELTQFSFDSRNRLTQAGNTQYQYDAENQRIAVNDTQYVINSQPNLSQALVRTKGNGEVTYYVYGLGLIGEESAGNYFSYHFDYRGSTIAITNITGQLLDSVQYSPFGVILSQPIFDTPFLFNGLYGVMTDGNRLNYMRARYYSAEIRRFVNQDILLGSIADGQSLNRFAFVTGNPVSFVDPFGLAEMLGGEYEQNFGDSRVKFDGKGDTSVCQYYDEMMKQVPNCSYYKSASQICRGPGDFREDFELLEIIRSKIVDIAVTLGFGLSHSIAIGDGYSLRSDVYLSETLTQIRLGLVKHDTTHRQQGLLDANGCVCGDYIDKYHNIVFEASGVRAIFYGGNLWWRIYPNPVPNEECQQCGK